MQTSSHLYTIPLDDVIAIAEQINLPRQTHIEPSRYTGYLFDNVSHATLFRMTFDAKYWPTNVDGLYLLYAETTYEILEWISSLGFDHKVIEITGIVFNSDEDRKNFQNAIWSSRTDEGAEIC